ncbi:ammonium transporter [Acinetobacter nectaris]|uniref:ammonium transporter n=1 Tax=Acinetobacter nectaris TaxID=1219382 RepID=UPI001F360DA0|nr:ammonium transporter [Acinetobacter nectaris]MCF9045509.1 ammonium transporter [Acinetobacter nectaris]
MGLWVAIIIIVFVTGSIFSLRINPREKAIGIMRDKARQMSLHPRLVPAPEWTKIPKMTETRASMVAFYSILLPQATMPLMRACVENNQLVVVNGSDKFQHLQVDLKGIYAVEMQSNYVGLYWDEDADIHATQLEQMKSYLVSLAEI